jgi:hypothetical protein
MSWFKLTLCLTINTTDTMKKYFLLICLLTVFTGLKCQIISVEQPMGCIEQFDRSDWEIRVIANWADPYDPDQVALDMHITNPDGTNMVLPCFYVSGESGDTSFWCARLATLQSGNHIAWFQLSENGMHNSRSIDFRFTATPSIRKGFLRLHNNWSFRYDNGEPFRGIGENICWESRDEDDSKFFKQLHEDKRFNYEYMLRELAAHGGNFFRTWMIYWNLPVDWKQVTNNSRYTSTNHSFNPSGMARLDRLVELSDSLGIHMMLALESHVGLMGTGWEMSSYNKKNGGFAETPDEFFSNQNARTQYKKKLRLMVARYGYSPSIAAWEFFNEVDNAMYHQRETAPISHHSVTDWHREMSKYLKSIDPYKHLVTTSISHREIEGLNDIDDIDLNQKHIYCNTLGIPQAINHFSKAHNKPYVIGECGFHWDWSINFNDYAAQFEADFRNGLWLGLFNPTPITPMTWWWEFFENRGMMPYFSIVKSVNDEMLEAGNSNFEKLPVLAPNENIEVHAVACGPKTFVFVLNKTNAPIKCNIPLTNVSKGFHSVESINTLTGGRVKQNRLVAKKKLLMLDFGLAGNQSIIFVLAKQ